MIFRFAVNLTKIFSIGIVKLNNLKIIVIELFLKWIIMRSTINKRSWMNIIFSRMNIYSLNLIYFSFSFRKNISLPKWMSILSCCFFIFNIWTSSLQKNSYHDLIFSNNCSIDCNWILQPKIIATFPNFVI